MSQPIPFTDSPEFLKLLAGRPDADLPRIALEIARDADPWIEPEPYLARLDELAERIRPRCRAKAPVEEMLKSIRWALFVEEGFAGNFEHYDDPRNSYLNEVIDRRLGIPITLGVVYQAVADRLGIRAGGVNLPAHFVLRVDLEDGRPVFIDAFEGGRHLGSEDCRRLVSERLGRPLVITEEHLRPVPTRAIVARMLRNLRHIHERSGDFPALAEVLKRLVAIDPRDADHHRDLGVISLKLDRPSDAVRHLSQYLQRPNRPKEDDDTIEGLLRLSQRRVAERN